MASTKGSKVLGNAKKAEDKKLTGTSLNKGSGSYGPKTTDPKMVGKVHQGNKSVNAIGADENVYTGAKGSAAFKRGRAGGQFMQSLVSASRPVKSGGFNSKKK